MKRTVLLTCFTAVTLFCYAQNNSEYDKYKEDVLESESVTLLVNDYVEGQRLEHVTPRIIDDPSDENNKCIVVTTNENPENTYDAQLFISTDKTFKAGDHVKLTLRLKADEIQMATIHVHASPGDYVSTCAELIIGTEWTSGSLDFTVDDPLSRDDIRTFAFNLSYPNSSNNCYFDDVYMAVLSPVEFAESDFEASGKYGSYEYVDLGLSVKWATANIGAKKLYDSGYYYAWGETKPKEDYSWGTYQWCNGVPNALTKYCNNDDYGYLGFTDKKAVLDKKDDVASVIMGKKWRMPTADNFLELKENCTWTWGVLNGVYGHKMTSNKNGKSIFLPEAGCHHGTESFHQNILGNYWSSTLLDTENPSHAAYFNMGADFNGIYTDERFFGRSVRAVYP